MPSPFELDSERKAGAELQYRDKRARLNTCQCGVIRRYHSMEKALGRCQKFEAMTLKQWADWLGVEYKEI